jgi:hypothetical protein
VQATSIVLCDPVAEDLPLMPLIQRILRQVRPIARGGRQCNPVQGGTALLAFTATLAM